MYICKVRKKNKEIKMDKRSIKVEKNQSQILPLVLWNKPMILSPKLPML